MKKAWIVLFLLFICFVTNSICESGTTKEELLERREELLEELERINQTLAELGESEDYEEIDKLRADKSMEAPPLGLDVWKERLNSPLHACAVWFQRLDDVQVPKKEEVCL